MPRAVVGCTQLAETVTVAVPSPRSFEDVDTGKAEVVGAREHVAVVGVDLAVAVLARGSEMHGITGEDVGVPEFATACGSCAHDRAADGPRFRLRRAGSRRRGVLGRSR